MALFGKTKKEETKEKPAKKPAVKRAPKKAAAPAPEVKSGVPVFDAMRREKTVILHPHITEKATMLSEMRMYTFAVARDANKAEVARAIKKLYKVTPVAVRIVNQAPRREAAKGNSRTRRPTLRPGMKKAYVTLKEGEQISFV